MVSSAWNDIIRVVGSLAPEVHEEVEAVESNLRYASLCHLRTSRDKENKYFARNYISEYYDEKKPQSQAWTKSPSSSFQPNVSSAIPSSLSMVPIVLSGYLS